MKKSPLVMCLTNHVAADLTANVLLAVGAKPAMVEEVSEARELAFKADAALINLGTVTPAQAEAMFEAVDACESNDVPWVLDPVGCQLLEYRAQLARQFVELSPTLIRANHEEANFLVEEFPDLGDGDIPLLATGRVDFITGRDPDGEMMDPLEVEGGVPLLQSVTATGCAQGALCAAALGRGYDPISAALIASRLMKRAGEIAFSRANAPGSFRVALVDAIYELGFEGAGAERRNLTEEGN